MLSLHQVRRPMARVSEVCHFTQEEGNQCWQPEFNKIWIFFAEQALSNTQQEIILQSCPEVLVTNAS